MVESLTSQIKGTAKSKENNIPNCLFGKEVKYFSSFIKIPYFCTP